MQGSLRFARILGVEVGLHYSWFVVLALVTWSLSAVYFPGRYPFWSTEMAVAAGVIASLLFFSSVLVHELAHSVVAQRVGLEVENITLFIFGGMASINREAERARDEFAIAIAGPASSIALGFGFGMLGWLASGTASLRVIAAVAWWLGTINLLLGIFNLIPGFPMDGGRVFRSLLWGITKDYWLATRIAAITGMGIAYAIILGGIYLAANGVLANAVWLLLVGWFLSSAANSSYRQARLREALKGITVGQAMERDYASVSPYVTLSEAFDTYFRSRRPMAVPVIANEGRVIGILTGENLRRVPRDRWPVTPVEVALRGDPGAPPVAPGQQVNDVLNALGNREFAAAPVLDGDHLVGLLTQTGIADLIRHRRRRA